MRKRFEAEWEVADGYVGKRRPQRSHLSLGDFEEDMDKADIEQAVLVQIQSDFEQQITWECNNLDELVDEIHDALQEQKEKEEE